MKSGCESIKLSALIGLTLLWRLYRLTPKLFCGLLAAVGADDFVELEDEVFGDGGLDGVAIDELGEGDGGRVGLGDGDLAEDFVLGGDNDADEIAGDVVTP